MYTDLCTLGRNLEYPLYYGACGLIGPQSETPIYNDHESGNCKDRHPVLPSVVLLLRFSSGGYWGAEADAQLSTTRRSHG